MRLVVLFLLITSFLVNAQLIPTDTGEYRGRRENNLDSNYGNGLEHLKTLFEYNSGIICKYILDKYSSRKEGPKRELFENAFKALSNTTYQKFVYKPIFYEFTVAMKSRIDGYLTVEFKYKKMHSKEKEVYSYLQNNWNEVITTWKTEIEFHDRRRGDMSMFHWNNRRKYILRGEIDTLKRIQASWLQITRHNTLNKEDWKLKSPFFHHNLDNPQHDKVGKDKITARMFCHLDMSAWDQSYLTKKAQIIYNKFTHKPQSYVFLLSLKLYLESRCEWLEKEYRQIPQRKKKITVPTVPPIKRASTPKVN